MGSSEIFSCSIELDFRDRNIRPRVHIHTSVCSKLADHDTGIWHNRRLLL